MSQQAIKQYYRDVENVKQFGGTSKETSIRSPFAWLINQYAQPKGLLLVQELSLKNSGKRPDGTLRDSLTLDWGYWESKDSGDDLDKEIQKKFAIGYPKDNILFEDSENAVLFQGGEEIRRVKIVDTAALDWLLKNFVGYERPEVSDFYGAIEAFKQDIPTIAEALRSMIAEQEKNNSRFKSYRQGFLELCQNSINPAIGLVDIDEMLIQHILTEDIFASIFDETAFHHENNIAQELEKVVLTFFTRDTRRATLSKIQHYYLTIKAQAARISDHHRKQSFLKMIYENFYKAYNPKKADTLGVVYTPNEVVKFMLESTNHLLNLHFGKEFEDEGVEILDPATGTGTFICDLIDYIRKDKLEHKYKNEIHANEVAILPYYIANLNIEYTYKQRMGQYAEFKNLCFMDTLDNTDSLVFDGQKSGNAIQANLFGFTAENVERIKNQNAKKISVIIGNPPYNAKQENYNYQNANKAYAGIDQRIKNTYIKHGTAQNQIVLYDMYVRFFRWATDRLDKNGMVSFISNSSFIDGKTFDGFRKIVGDEYNFAYIINLKGNARTSGEQRRKEGGNIFSDEVRVGIAIYFFIKKENQTGFKISYHEVPDYWSAEEKKDFVAKAKIETINFEKIKPDENHIWINQTDNDFETLLPLISKETKNAKNESDVKAIFKMFSGGVKSQRDEWVYDFDKTNLQTKIKYFADIYQQTLKHEIEQRHLNPSERTTFEHKFKIKWDSDLDTYLKRGIEKEFEENKIIESLYRPFTKKYFYFDKHFNGRTYQWNNIIGGNGLRQAGRHSAQTDTTEENVFMIIPGLASPKDFHTIASKQIVDLNCLPAGCQCIPFYYYNDAGERQENITDWALEEFRKRYGLGGVSLTLRQAQGEMSKGMDNSNKSLRQAQTDTTEYITNKNSTEQSPNETHENNLGDVTLTLRQAQGDTSKSQGDKNDNSLPITKESIFHYVYAVLHNPVYLKQYEQNLKRDFPRIPFYDNFNRWAYWGKLLVEMHSNFENEYIFGLEVIRNESIKNPKTKLKADKITGEIILTDSCTLRGVPSGAWEYKLGNRSAIEWVLDQYKEKTENIELDGLKPYNFLDYENEVIDLLQKICNTSVKTVNIMVKMEKTLNQVNKSGS